MPLTFVLDELLRGVLWHALKHHNKRGIDPVDVTRVGDPVDLPRGTLDPDLLQWAARVGRLLLSHDLKTMPGHFAAFLQQGNHSPGLLQVREGFTYRELVETIVLIAYAGDPADYVDQIRFIP
jgi:hypothetical protein